MENYRNQNERNQNESKIRSSKVFLSESKDTHSYRGWLNSDSFTKRALAVFGYSMAVQIVLSAVIMLILYLFIFASVMSSSVQ